MTRFAWAFPALSGVAGGMLLAAETVLFRSLSAGQAILGLGQELLWFTPLGFLLVWISLQRLHCLHWRHSNFGERWGFRVAVAGLAVAILGSLHWSGFDLASRPVLAALLSFVGTVAIRLGLVAFAIGAQRSGVLAARARLLLLLSAGALTLSTVTGIARQESVQEILGIAGWLLWSFVNTETLLDRGLVDRLEPTGQSFSLREIVGAFVSKATIITAIISVGVWSLDWEWYVGVIVVLLLYAHELGHVVAALVRGVSVHRAPYFVPGLGAFVQTASGSSHWDDVWVSLGGPLVGGACALSVKLLGLGQANTALAHAGDVGLWLNVVNLAPFSPLDGGRVATRTGWFGLAITIVLGVFLLTRGLMDSVLLAFIGFGLWRAFVAVRTVHVGWGTQIGVLVVYLGSILVLLVAALGTEPVPWLKAPRPDWLPGVSDVFTFMFWFFVAGAFAVPYALRDEQGAMTRYGGLALFGWTRYVLDGRHWVVPLMCALFAETVGIGRMGWVERYIERLARRHDPRAGEAAALAFDCRRRQGDSADQWLEKVAPVLKSGGPAVLGEAFLSLSQQGYKAAGLSLLRTSLAHGEFAAELSPLVANNYAWLLFGAGEPAEALPYARCATAADPENRYYLGTLGHVLLELAQAEAAESHLRRALAIEDRSGMRIALARALAEQGRIGEALTEGEEALRSNVGRWYEEEQTLEEAQAYMDGWRRMAGRTRNQAVP